MLNIQAKKREAGKRLDIVLASRLPILTRSFIASLVKRGLIKVDKQPVKAGHKLKGSEAIEIDYDLEANSQLPDIELPVIYEDEDCIVINKPAGILTHSKGVFNPEATVASFIAPKLRGLKGDRAGIVHRLDRATSGVIICAIHPQALAHLQKQFSSRKVKKIYHAIVSGHLKNEEAIIDMPIERNPKEPKTFRAGPGGKPAITHYNVLKFAEKYELLKLQPQTGRTHQLRVHLNKLGHPIVGDVLYKGEPADRLYLHASSLEITLPGSSRKVFEAPLPQEFNNFVEKAHAVAR
jgi:23S rRNA pseudouridine1911/1915/1917 synthase